MMTGRENLQLINQHLYQAQTAQEEAGLRLNERHRQLDALRLETGDRYRELARLRLNDLQANQLVLRLDETDQVILTLLEKLKQTRHDLEEQIKASVSRKQTLEEQRKELARQRDEAGKAVQHQLEQTRERVSAREAYRQQQKRVQEAAAVARKADEKASRSEKDRLEKGKPYEADHLFMYLWNKRYLTPDYQTGWFGRQLDSWVAKHIDFQRNRSNYYMLQELPHRLREHATSAQQTAQLEAQALETMARQAAEEDGILALQTRAEEAEKQIKQHDAQIEAEEARYRQLLQQQTAFNEAADPSSKQIIEVQAAALQRKEITELLREARATPRPEDDVTVARLQQIQQQQNQIAAEIQSINQFVQQQQRNMAELEELRRRYRQNGYDAYNSSFPGDFALGALLGQLLQGLMNSDMIWQELGRQQRSQPPGHPGGFGGGFGGSGNEAGGFGGGEFRTGGGF